MKDISCFFRRALLAAMCCFFAMSTDAQEIFVRPFPLFYRLPTNEMFDIHQDREGFIWMGTTNGLVRYDGHHILTIRSDYSNLKRLTCNDVSVIADSEKLLWAGTRKGLNLLDKQTGRTWAFPDKRLSAENINALCYSSSDKTMWVGSNSGSVYQCTEQGRVLKHFERLSTKAATINDLYSDSHGFLWVIANNGIYMFDAARGKFREYGGIPGQQNVSLFTMIEDKNGNYWVGTWGLGVYRFRPNQPAGKRYERKSLVNMRTCEQDGICYSMAQDGNKGHLWLLSYNSLYEIEVEADGGWHQIDNSSESYAHKMYTRIITDREGDLWLSSYDMAYTLFFNHSDVYNFPLPQIKSQWGWDSNLLDLAVTNDGTVWLTQDRYGLCIYDMAQEKFLSDQHKVTEVASSIDLMRKAARKPGVWIYSSSRHLLQRMERRDSQVVVCEQTSLPDSKGQSAISNFLEDRNGVIWLLADKAVYKRTPDGTVSRVQAKRRNVILLFPDDKGNIYALSEDGTWTGLTQPSTHVWRAEPAVTLTSACMDNKSRLWGIASDGRVLRQEQGKQALTSIRLEKETEGCSLLGILPSGNNVWIVANRKIIQYDTEHERQLIYEAGNGEIAIDLFRHNAFCDDGSNGLYAGGHNGFIHIAPRQSGTWRKTIADAPFVTDVAVDGKSVFQNADGSNRFDKITLPADCRNVNISFSLLRYAPNQHVRIAWRLEGVDKDWTWLSSDNNYQAFYNILPKGAHKFQIKVEVSPGVFSEPYDCLTVYRQPAFYETWWACLLYIILLAAAAYTMLRYALRRMRKADERRMAEELAQTKMDYFTNVSHELLTPLSVISCIAETLDVPKENSSKITILNANINRLRRLIQQALDFRRTDAGRLSLRTSRGDIGKFVKQTCETNFLLPAMRKGITLNVTVPAVPMMGYVDFEKLDKILYNLLSNALKYTPQGGKIDVECRVMNEQDADGRPSMKLTVKDNGAGIDEKEQEKIFTRYYSNRHPGTESHGIGLSLTRSFVELHGGNISVESVLHKGSVFTVVLPIDNKAENKPIAGSVSASAEHGNTSAAEAGKPITGSLAGKTVLLMDDNVELLTLTASYLSATFSVLKATTIKEAWELLTANNGINLIIADVLFPDGNGLEFCRKVKHDVRFCHLPVIILTAKTTELDRMQSYQSGADGYLSKPFSFEVLLARAKNLLWLDETRKASFRKNVKNDFGELGCTKEDQVLAEHVTSIIEAHLPEAGFDLNRLAEKIGLSKSTLHRKIKALTGMTPAEFIRNVKMKKAIAMIMSKDITIAEVAYALGFSDPKYFTKCFKEEFGVTPTKYKQQKTTSGI